MSKYQQRITMIELLDGPLAGRLHELNADPFIASLGVPDRMALPDNEDKPTVRHWYAIVPGTPTAVFLRTESM